MSFTVAASGTGNVLEPACTPHEINVAVVNDGEGGTLYITQGTPAPAGTFDPVALFGGAFNATPWMAFFKRTWLTAQDAAKEFFKTYSVTFTPVLGQSLPPPSMRFDSSLLTGKAVLFFDAAESEGGAQWRMEIRLRNTLTR